jgi:hypothetical protein
LDQRPVAPIDRSIPYGISRPGGHRVMLLSNESRDSFCDARGLDRIARREPSNRQLADDSEILPVKSSDAIEEFEPRHSEIGSSRSWIVLNAGFGADITFANFLGRPSIVSPYTRCGYGWLFESRIGLCHETLLGFARRSIRFPHYALTRSL